MKGAYYSQFCLFLTSVPLCYTGLLASQFCLFLTIIKINKGSIAGKQLLVLLIFNSRYNGDNKSESMAGHSQFCLFLTRVVGVFGGCLSSQFCLFLTPLLEPLLLPVCFSQFCLFLTYPELKYLLVGETLLVLLIFNLHLMGCVLF